MSIALDIIILVIIAVNIIIAWRQGFVKMVLRSLTIVVALAAAFMLVVPVRNHISETQFAVNTETKIHAGVVEMVDSITDDGEEKDEGKSKADIVTLLSYAGIDADEISADIDNWIATKAEDIKISIADKVAPALLKTLLTFIVFTVIFVAVFVAATVAVILLEKFTELPVLKQANTALGIAVGCVVALVEVCTFVSLTQMLISYNAIGGIFAGVTPESTFLFKFFSNYNIFGLLF